MRHKCPGFILGTCTWRASPDWVARRLGSADRTAEVNRLAMEEARKLRDEFKGKTDTRVVLVGNVGPRGDGYSPKNFMTAGEAERYHQLQVVVADDDYTHT